MKCDLISTLGQKLLIIIYYSLYNIEGVKYIMEKDQIKLGKAEDISN